MRKPTKSRLAGLNRVMARLVLRPPAEILWATVSAGAESQEKEQADAETWHQLCAPPEAFSHARS